MRISTSNIRKDAVSAGTASFCMPVRKSVIAAGDSGYTEKKRNGAIVGMCTSIAFAADGFFFGRNLDLECQFGERVVITPRKYPFLFRDGERLTEHYAMIGMAAVEDGYPLYAEAGNEKGLCMAGLNFPGNAFYPEEKAAGKANISPFELIPWILGQCASVAEARRLLERTHIRRIHFSERMQLSPLHWHIADRRESIVLEAVRDGMHVHDNPAGVMTNNPPLDFHLTNLRQYLNLTTDFPENRFTGRMELEPFGVGMGAVGLPGDFSPASRFVKAAFLRMNAPEGMGHEACLAHFFHMLDAVAMPDGIVRTKRGLFERTSYSCCFDADEGVFYYKTYENNRLTAVDMRRMHLDGKELVEYEVVRTQQTAWAN